MASEKRQEPRRLGDLRRLDRDAVLSVSIDTETLGDLELPKVVTFETVGGEAANLFVRVEVREGSPKIVEVRWTAHPHQRQVSQQDLRSVELAELAISMMTEATAGRGSTLQEAWDDDSPAYLRTLKLVARQRMSPDLRRIDDGLLSAVALLYTNNIDGSPTKAVAEFFHVSSRTASTYVARAREKGLLPATKRGKKKA